MPKEIRKKSTSRLHAQSAKVSRPVQEEETLLPVPSTSQAAPIPIADKKDAKRTKHDALMQRIEESQAPYSKSHARRMKRKSREQLAGGMTALESVLQTMDDDTADADTKADSKPSRPDSKSKVKQIGEGKSSTLTEKQRKKQLQLERLRHPLILSNPQFSVNPFETIRTHARNTLLQHAGEAQAQVK